MDNTARVVQLVFKPSSEKWSASRTFDTMLYMVFDFFEILANTFCCKKVKSAFSIGNSTGDGGGGGAR